MHDTYIHVHTYMYVYDTYTCRFLPFFVLIFIGTMKMTKSFRTQNAHVFSDPYFISLCRVLINCSKNLSVLISALPEAPGESLFPCPSCSWSSSVPCECRTEAWDPGWLCEGAALCLLRLHRDPHNSPFVLKARISASTSLLGFLFLAFFTLDFFLHGGSYD